VGQRLTMLARTASLLLSVAMLIGLVVLVIAGDIARYGNITTTANADAALVLGAAVLGDVPSPVFEERLRHAAALHRAGRVGRIVLTGGRSPEDDLTEAEAGRRWLIADGIPASAMLIEERSRTTLENFLFSAPILAENGIGTVLVVSDPIHMRRAMEVAERIGLSAEPSPTETSRYQSLATQIPFVLRETWFMAQYLLLGQ
jgi:uncharacterized SAM-binding protein YcdF (DUF218 family)